MAREINCRTRKLLDSALGNRTKRMCYSSSKIVAFDRKYRILTVYIAIS